MTAPIHTRPFNVEHAKAGAPYCGSNGEAVRAIIWDRKHPTHPIIVIEEDGDQEAVAFRADGTTEFAHPSMVQKLVMLPLGYIDGKPVFVGDQLVDPSGAIFVPGPSNGGHLAGCIWPAPEKVYPETRMTEGEIISSYYGGGPVNGRQEETAAFFRIANAALNHALATGQFITKEGHEAALHRLGESLRPVADAARAERDMAVAQAVESEMRAAGEQMAARRSARDMAVAQATKKACLVILAGEAFGQAPVVSYNHICAIDLTAIIAEVAP